MPKKLEQRYIVLVDGVQMRTGLISEYNRREVSVVVRRYLAQNPTTIEIRKIESNPKED